MIPRRGHGTLWPVNPPTRKKGTGATREVQRLRLTPLRHRTPIDPLGKTVQFSTDRGTEQRNHLGQRQRGQRTDVGTGLVVSPARRDLTNTMSWSIATSAIDHENLVLSFPS
jgi:hypothetical protein